jgi:hypothetical protein
MPDPDYKALCAELLAAMQTDDWEECEEVWARAKAALEARSEPVAPTDEELRNMWLSREWFNEGATLREFASIIRRWGTPANNTSEESFDA